MTEPLSPELKARAQELAARIVARSDADILDMTRRLVTTTTDTQFGNTEFRLRDSALGLVAHAYSEHLPETAGTPLPPASAPTADAAPPSTTPAPRPSDTRRSGRLPPRVLLRRLVRRRAVPVGRHRRTD